MWALKSPSRSMESPVGALSTTPPRASSFGIWLKRSQRWKLKTHLTGDSAKRLGLPNLYTLLHSQQIQLTTTALHDSKEHVLDPKAQSSNPLVNLSKLQYMAAKLAAPCLSPWANPHLMLQDETLQWCRIAHVIGKYICILSSPGFSCFSLNLNPIKSRTGLLTIILHVVSLSR